MKRVVVVAVILLVAGCGTNSPKKSEPSAAPMTEPAMCIRLFSGLSPVKALVKFWLLDGSAVTLENNIAPAEEAANSIKALVARAPASMAADMTGVSSETLGFIKAIRDQESGYDSTAFKNAEANLSATCGADG